MMLLGVLSCGGPGVRGKVVESLKCALNHLKRALIVLKVIFR